MHYIGAVGQTEHAQPHAPTENVTQSMGGPPLFCLVFQSYNNKGGIESAASGLVSNALAIKQLLQRYNTMSLTINLCKHVGGIW